MIKEIIKKLEKLDYEKESILEQLWDEIFKYDFKDTHTIIELLKYFIK